MRQVSLLSPPSYSEVIISKNYNDGEPLQRYHRTEDEETKIRKELRKHGTDPKILIVTDKLLTGFDAPILYAMYLDKPRGTTRFSRP